MPAPTKSHTCADVFAANPVCSVDGKAWPCVQALADAAAAQARIKAADGDA